jgi:hypothetical protein
MLIDFLFLSFSFSGLFGSSNTKDALPKRSTTVKHSSISDQIAPTKSTEEILSSERSINERFEYFLLIIFLIFCIIVQPYLKMTLVLKSMVGVYHRHLMKKPKLMFPFRFIVDQYLIQTIKLKYKIFTFTLNNRF